MANGFDIHEHDRALLEKEWQIFRAAYHYYYQELEVKNATEAEKHAQGVIAAVNAIYMLGQNDGYRKGFTDGRNGNAMEEKYRVCESTRKP